MRQRVVWLAGGSLGSGLAGALRSDGFDVLCRDLAAPPAAIALLDVDAVVIDGTASLAIALRTCREISLGLALPVIMLVAGGGESVELMCLSAGARQVASSQTPGRLLAARVRAAMPPAGTDHRDVTVGPLRLQRAAHHLECNGQGIELSSTEFILLEALMERPRHVLARGMLIRLAWDAPCTDRALESTLSRLRHKVLGAGGPRVAIPVRGVGYRLGIASAERG